MAAMKKEVNVSEHAVDEEPRELTMEEREAREDAEMKLEAQGPTNDDIQVPANDRYWRPGFTNRFPWLGFGALAFVCIAAGACVLTLSLADGVSQRRWPKQIAPNVIVSVLNNAANLCFGIAISNGVAIAWWRRTLQGASIEQLNRSWKFSSSIKDVVLGAKYFNVIALAALTAKLTIIDGTLLQRAFNTEIRQDLPMNVNFTGYANTTIANTGRVSDRTGTVEILATNWNDDLRIWLQGAGVLPNIYAGCNGTCYLDVPGAGFEFDCTEPNTTSINYGNSTIMAVSQLQTAGNGDCNETSRVDNATCATLLDSFAPPLFKVDFTPYYDNPLGYGNETNATNYSYIIMNLLWTVATDDGSANCPGTLHQQVCNLRPAIVNYPVQIKTGSGNNDASQSISLAVNNETSDTSIFRNFNSTGRQQNYFEVLSYNDIHENHLTGVDDSRTRVGGIAKGLNMYLGGVSTISWGGVYGYTLSQTGNSPTYLTNDLGVQTGGNADIDNQCGFQYANPMAMPLFKDNAASNLPQYVVPNIYHKINQIMFALALDISGEDDDADKAVGTLSRTGVMYQDTVHYKIAHSYMWGAFASSIFCVLCVLPVYWGYWQLGRNVTLGPFEIAAAFRAPNLYHETEKNAPIDDLIKEVGDRQVKFGAIVSGGDAGRIGVAEPEYVARIHPSAKASEIRKSWRASRFQSGTVGSGRTPPMSPNLEKQ